MLNREYRLPTNAGSSKSQFMKMDNTKRRAGGLEAVFPIRKYEFAAGWRTGHQGGRRAALKGGLAGCTTERPAGCTKGWAAQQSGRRDALKSGPADCRKRQAEEQGGPASCRTGRAAHIYVPAACRKGRAVRQQGGLC